MQNTSWIIETWWWDSVVWQREYYARFQETADSISGWVTVLLCKFAVVLLFPCKIRMSWTSLKCSSILIKIEAFDKDAGILRVCRLWSNLHQAQPAFYIMPLPLCWRLSGALRIALRNIASLRHGPQWKLLL